MPYIPVKERGHYDDAMNLLDTRLEQRHYKPGHVAYVYYTIAMRNLSELTAREHRRVVAASLGGVATRTQPTFDDRTRVLANLRAAADEFKRRHVDPYESNKCQENGDIT